MMNSMPNATIIYGGVLILIGIGGYVLTGMESPTALIPVVFGVPVVIAGGVAFQEGARKHAMHAAAGIALLATLAVGGDLGRLAAAGELFSRGMPAFASKALMCAASLVFVVLCVRSFIAARKARDAGGEAEAA